MRCPPGKKVVPVNKHIKSIMKFGVKFCMLFCDCHFPGLPDAINYGMIAGAADWGKRK